MDAMTLRSPTDWRVVVREQLALLARGRKRELIVLASVWVLLAAGLIAVWLREPAAGSGVMDPELFRQIMGGVYFGTVPILLLLIGAFWALSVWRDEGPDHRVYHWSMPVSRPAHDLWRVAGGGAWLLGIVAVALLCGIISVTVTGAFPLSDLGRLPVGFWIAWFTAPLTLYLLASVASLLSDYPARWIVAAPFGWAVLMGVLRLGWPQVARALDRALIDGAYGLGTAITAVPRLAEGALSGGTAGTQAFGAWLPAVLVWIAVGAMAVVAAARRHPA